MTKSQKPNQRKSFSPWNLENCFSFRRWCHGLDSHFKSKVVVRNYFGKSCVTFLSVSVNKDLIKADTKPQKHLCGIMEDFFFFKMLFSKFWTSAQKLFVSVPQLHATLWITECSELCVSAVRLQDSSVLALFSIVHCSINQHIKKLIRCCIVLQLHEN